jgi:hypothetical protein
VRPTPDPEHRAAASSSEGAAKCGSGCLWQVRQCVVPLPDPLALVPDSPFFLVARGDADLTLSVTDAGAFVTHLPCDVPRDLIYPRQDKKARIYEPKVHPLQIRRASGEAWVDDELARNPIPKFAHFEASVEARSPDDVWVHRTPGNQSYVPHGYFHWNGRVWETDKEMLTLPAGLVPFGLLDWHGTKLVPLLPQCDNRCEQSDLRQLPLFAVWGGIEAAPSFRSMAMDVPSHCRNGLRVDSYRRFSFATTKRGEVFVVDKPCEESPYRVGRWDKGRVTVSNFAASEIDLTAGKLGQQDTVLAWGTDKDETRPFLRWFSMNRWVPIRPPSGVHFRAGTSSLTFDGAGAVWMHFHEWNRFWRYAGKWNAYVTPGAGNMFGMAANHGDLWVSDFENPWLYRLRGEQWVRFPLFRDRREFGLLEVMPAAGDDTWVIARTVKTDETRIYRNRPMPLYAPCAR